MTSLAVVVPVRDGERLLERCLDTLVPETAAVGAQLVVVDDASRDRSASVARRAGAALVRLTRASGPYAARNEGWRHAVADIVVFVDVRTRARPGWLSALRDAFADPAVAIAGGDVVVQRGPTAAQRWAYENQHLLSRHGREGQFLPYFPTCNLAVRREVLSRLRGFRDVPSGGDVDFCWRAQLEGLGELRVVPGADVEWEPRGGVCETARQWHKYGTWNPRLYAAFAPLGCPMPRAPAFARLLASEVKAFAVGAIRRRVAIDVDAVDRLTRLAYWYGFQRSAGRGVEAAAAGSS